MINTVERKLTLPLLAFLLLWSSSLSAMYVAMPLGAVLMGTDTALTGTVITIDDDTYTIRVEEVIFGTPSTGKELHLSRTSVGCRSFQRPYTTGQPLLLCLAQGHQAIRGRSLTSSTLSVLGGGGEGEFRIENGVLPQLGGQISDFVKALQERESVRSTTIKTVFATQPGKTYRR